LSIEKIAPLKKDQINIAFYCSSVAYGGLEMNFVRYATWMKEAGWRVLIYCVNDTPIHRDALQSQHEIVIIQRNKKYFDLPNAWRVKNMFASQNIDICWFRDTRDFSILGLVKRLSGKKFKLLYQQAMQFGVSKKDPFHTMRFSPVDAWVSTLDFLAQQVKTMTHFAHDRIHIIPLGVNIENLQVEKNLKVQSREYFNLPQDKKIIGIIGRLDPLKGQDVAIRAIHQLTQTGNDAHLLIVGESTLHEGNSYENKLHQLAEELKVSDRVHFRPYNKEVFRFYHAIDIFALCSKGETFGTVTIEAMACNVPVVGTASSGTPEILQYGKCGLLYEPGDHNMLAEKLRLLIEDPQYANSLANAASERFHSEFSKEISAKRMDILLQKLAGENVHYKNYQI